MAKKQLSLPFPSEGESKVDIFQRQEIRKVMHNNEWWFVLNDILTALVETTNVNSYIKTMRARDEGLREGWSQIVTPLSIDTLGGIQHLNCVNIQGIFRIMQSVPSSKAEPFKKWLARVGFERLEEIRNPELALTRAITLYRAKGYADGWIEARIRNKASREMVTGEWKRGGVTEYIGLLTDAISVQTFGVGVKEHKLIKGLKTQSLRDNMTPMELTLTTLGEQATTEIIRATNPNGLEDHHSIAKRGGQIAGDARRQIEDATGQKVLSRTNYLTEKQRQNNDKNTTELNEIMQKLLGTPSQQTTRSADKPLKINESFDNAMKIIAKSGNEKDEVINDPQF